MIYMRHNIAQNFMSADASGDAKMKNDIIMSEIAKLIVHCRARVIMHLKEVGVTFRRNPSKRELVKAVTEAMHNSKRFAQAIMTDVASGVCGGKHIKSADGKDADHELYNRRDKGWMASGDVHHEMKDRMDKGWQASGSNLGWNSMTASEKRNCTDAGGVMVYNAGTGKYECKLGMGQAKKGNKLFGADAGDAQNKVEDVGALLGSVAALTLAAGNLFGGKKKKSDPSGANQTKVDAEKDLNAKVNIVSNPPQATSHVGRNIAIGVGVALAITAAGVIIYKMTHKHAA